MLRSAGRRIKVSDIDALRTLYEHEGTHQVENAGGLCLIFNALGKEQETLASLASMCSIGVSNLQLFITDVVGQMLGLDGIAAEPEELLGESKAPAMMNFELVS